MIANPARSGILKFLYLLLIMVHFIYAFILLTVSKITSQKQTSKLLPFLQSYKMLVNAQKIPIFT